MRRRISSVQEPVGELAARPRPSACTGRAVSPDASRAASAGGAGPSVWYDPTSRPSAAGAVPYPPKPSTASAANCASSAWSLAASAAASRSRRSSVSESATAARRRSCRASCGAPTPRGKYRSKTGSNTGRWPSPCSSAAARPSRSALAVGQAERLDGRARRPRSRRCRSGRRARAAPATRRGQPLRRRRPPSRSHGVQVELGRRLQHVVLVLEERRRACRVRRPRRGCRRRARAACGPSRWSRRPTAPSAGPSRAARRPPAPRTAPAPRRGPGTLSRTMRRSSSSSGKPMWRNRQRRRSASDSSRLAFEVRTTNGRRVAVIVPSSGTVTWKSLSTSRSRPSTSTSALSVSSISSTFGSSPRIAVSSGRGSRNSSLKMSVRVSSHVSSRPARDAQQLLGVVPLVQRA